MKESMYFHIHSIIVVVVVVIIGLSEAIDGKSNGTNKDETT